MAKNSNSNSQLPSSISTPIYRTATPSSEFYSVFSEAEVVGIIDALESRRELPLKYSYKGRGAKIWDKFYSKYVIPSWLRPSSVEIDLLRDNFDYINGNLQGCKVNVVDVGSGNSYPVKAFIYKLNKLSRIHQYTALDISEELLNLSRKNFTKWFPQIKYASYPIDIENSCLPEVVSSDRDNVEADDTAKVILHLGVTIGNHQNRAEVLKNFRESMGKSDLLVFTNEMGSHSNWDGKVRGGFKYHAEQIYAWIKNEMGIRAEDCELVRKYDDKTDSIVANMKLCQGYCLNFSFKGVDKTIKISEGEEITIWRHHKHEIPEVLQEIEQAGLELVRYSTNQYLSHIMVICRVARN